jgi:DNA-binding NarL/FixJ family response regulator
VALRLVVADDNFLVREGLVALLAEVDGIDVVGMASDTPSLIKLVDEALPDAVLTDIRMPPGYTDEGIAAAKRIRAEHPDVGVVVLSQYVEEDYAFQLLVDGVTGLGYLLKERLSDVDELVRALREVSSGGSVLDPKVVEALVARKGVDAGPLGGLTGKEREVLRVMASGSNNAAIASTLFMSERGVEKHIGAVFQKLGLLDEHVTNRRVMAVLAYLDAIGPGR